MNAIKSISLSFFIIIVMFPASSFSEPSKSIMTKIEASLAGKEISRDDAAMYKTFFLFDRSRLPARFLGEGPATPVKNATLIIRNLKRDFNSFLPQTKETLRPYLFKSKGTSYFPQESAYYGRNGASKIATTGGFGFDNYTVTDNFKIQWGSAIKVNPDYVANLAQYLEDSWTNIITGQGYKDPLPDNLLDVYIGATDHINANYSQAPIYPYIYGYVTYYGNIHVPYMVVNHEYSWVYPNDDPENRAIGAMKVTAAHEYFHIVQFAIDDREDSWWMEATATWIEDEVFDEVNDYFHFINRDDGWTKHPNVSLQLFNGSHEYGSAIWGKYLSESWGGVQAIKSIWDNCQTGGPNALSAINSFFMANSTSLKEEFQKFAAKNIFMNYSEGNGYGKMITHSSHSFYPASRNSMDFIGKSPDYLGTNYIHFLPASGTDLTITFDGDQYYRRRDIEWGANIVLSTMTGYSTVKIPLDPDQQNGYATIKNYGNYGDIYLVATVLSPTGITPLEDSYLWYSDYPDGVPYAYHACEDCPGPPPLPLDEFTNNDGVISGGGGSSGGVTGIGISGTDSNWSTGGGEGSGGSCFIATAAYGYYDEPHVMLLREFRDQFLLTNVPGRRFVNLYYRISPDMADFISEREWLKSLVRIMLMPLIGFAWLSLKMPAMLFLSLLIILSAMSAKLYYFKKNFKKQSA
ncbi:MAG: hypothetical protein OEV42_06300 [Deltaproteobacteria bacterium]|nr:hypothetical protein [Deltaproteobacteria bacterium]